LNLSLNSSFPKGQEKLNDPWSAHLAPATHPAAGRPLSDQAHRLAPSASCGDQPLWQPTRKNHAEIAITLHYQRTDGGKPPLVLCHGFSDCHVAWQRPSAVITPAKSSAITVGL
jgi:hypothetical protein